MDNMTLGGYLFDWNPDQFGILKEEKYTGVVLTYGSIGYFSFGTSIVGKQILLEWNWMKQSQFDTLNGLYLSDESKIWIPGDGYIYTVEILKLDGMYFEVSGLDAPYRKEVKMLLLIIERTVEL